jgi:hypothetical protein
MKPQNVATLREVMLTAARTNVRCREYHGEVLLSASSGHTWFKCSIADASELLAAGNRWAERAIARGVPFKVLR